MNGSKQPSLTHALTLDAVHVGRGVADAEVLEHARAAVLVAVLLHQAHVELLRVVRLCV